MTFEEYWKQNIDRYKDMARADLARLEAGAWCGHISIDTDDDFSLDIKYDFAVYADTETELRAKMKAIITGAKLTSPTSKEWAWLGLCSAAVQMLDSDEQYLSYGGNQMIEVSISENQ